MFLVPARFFFWGRLSLFLLFVISNVCTNKHQLALLLLFTQFSSIEYKEKKWLLSASLFENSG